MHAARISHFIIAVCFSQLFIFLNDCNCISTSNESERANIISVVLCVADAVLIISLD